VHQYLPEGSNQTRVGESRLTKTTNIMLVGVGGQGIILAGEVLAHALVLAGHDVKKAEIHGMAQRGGSVRSDVRFGRKVFSPTIPPGRADMLLAFEQLEALRHLPEVRRGGLVIVSTESIVPTTAHTGPHAYPQDVPALLRSNSVKVYEVDAPRLAAEAGNARTAGTCLVAAASWHLKVAEEIWELALRDVFPSKILDVNLRAFALARTATRPSQS
jgi:indolepyruvate ferredoxin oxidoreductase beta subunit